MNECLVFHNSAEVSHDKLTIANTSQQLDSSLNVASNMLFIGDNSEENNLPF